MTPQQTDLVRALLQNELATNERVLVSARDSVWRAKPARKPRTKAEHAHADKLLASANEYLNESKAKHQLTQDTIAAFEAMVSECQHLRASSAASDVAAPRVDTTSIALHDLLRDWNALRDHLRGNSDFKDGVKQCIKMLQKVVDGVDKPALPSVSDLCKSFDGDEWNKTTLHYARLVRRMLHNKYGIGSAEKFAGDVDQGDY
jgi:hypothetical protein